MREMSSLSEAYSGFSARPARWASPRTSSRLRKTSAETRSGSGSVASSKALVPARLVAARAHLRDRPRAASRRPACRRRSRRRGRPWARPGREWTVTPSISLVWKLRHLAAACAQRAQEAAAAARRARRPPSPRRRRRRSGSRRESRCVGSATSAAWPPSAGSRSFSGSTPASFCRRCASALSEPASPWAPAPAVVERVVDRGPEIADPDVAEGARAGLLRESRLELAAGSRTRSGSSARASGRAR